MVQDSLWLAHGLFWGRPSDMRGRYYRVVVLGMCNYCVSPSHIHQISGALKAFLLPQALSQNISTSATWILTDLVPSATRTIPWVTWLVWVRLVLPKLRGWSGGPQCEACSEVTEGRTNQNTASCHQNKPAPRCQWPLWLVAALSPTHDAFATRP